MIETIYIERAVSESPRAQRIRDKYRRARIIECDHYGEIFNRKNQNFRLQKSLPSLILAHKTGHRIYPAPADHAIGAENNFYFSHMLNCPFDCRYCFLQGKFDSANFVLFVNYEDFLADIRTAVDGMEGPVHLFSGYDCDSLAFEPVSGFIEWFVPALSERANLVLEIRTKSTQIRQLMAQPASDNALIAYSLAPQVVIDEFEHGTASLAERLKALTTLQSAGWQVGLRLDPLLSFVNCEAVYRDFFTQLAANINFDRVHSITLGTMRLPNAYAKKMRKLYPEERLFSSIAQIDPDQTGYAREEQARLLDIALSAMGEKIDLNRVFVQGKHC